MLNILSRLSPPARRAARAVTQLVASRSGGFTMIELLIVIAILGILAVAVLSAINPIEQINRGRDTGSKSDAEQLLSAVDRYQAFQGYYPWQSAPDTLTRALDPITEMTAPGDVVDDSAAACPISEKLSMATTAGCTGSDELKVTFFDRILGATYNNLWIYNQGTNLGDSTYVCFVPQSAAFQTEARNRCTAGLPADIGAAAEAIICAANTEMVCLP